MKTYLHSPTLKVALFCILFAQMLSAQAPTVNCPTVLPLELNDYSNNNTNYWNAAWWWDPLISSHDLGETPASGLQITATDHCSTSGNLTFRYILSLDLDYNNVYETFIDSDSLPVKNTVYVGNSPNNLFSGTARSFDNRAVSADQKWGFDIAITPDGTNRKAQVIWKNTPGQPTDAEIPYGNHHIKWFVTDGCGVTSVCEYDFMVQDTKKPEVFCINGLSVNILNVQGIGMVQLWASDFLQSTTDNYTPTSQLKIGIRRSGTGTGFPYSADGTAQTGVQFTCFDLWLQPVELWSLDKFGNQDFCETYVLVSDNLEYCNFDPIIMGYHGKITTEKNEGVSDVMFKVELPASWMPWVSNTIFTDSTGHYYIGNSWPFNFNTEITPMLENDPLNGITAWDLVLISRHILGLNLLDSPYKIISADANRSGTVTTFDMVEIRKLILGTYTEFPDNTSWRFIDKTQTFSNNLNPFADSLKESIPVTATYSKDFTGCKIGDVDLTAAPHFKGDDVENRNISAAFISLINSTVTAGQTFNVRFNSPHDIEALQMTVTARGLRIDHITPVEGSTQDNFALFPGNIFTTVLIEENAAFDVQFTALTSGELKDMLEINSDITQAVCFGSNGAPQSLAFRFVDDILPGDVPVLYAPSPNPWKESTQIGFYLPNDSDVQLSVVDPNGAVVKTVSGSFTAGEHQMRFSKNDFPRAGMYYVRMRAGDFVEVKKMVLMR